MMKLATISSSCATFRSLQRSIHSVKAEHNFTLPPQICIAAYLKKKLYRLHKLHAGGWQYK
jgi:hypothetical protein